MKTLNFEEKIIQRPLPLKKKKQQKPIATTTKNPL